VIFVDTSAIYALADAADLNHGRAVELAQRAAVDGETLVLHNYIVVESTALLQRRLGLDSATRFLRETDRLRLHWVSEDDHASAVDLLSQRGLRQLSLVDCISFIVMSRLEIESAFAFDADFQREGFRRYPHA
jgi:predicted nucleic acid-binding protein